MNRINKREFLRYGIFGSTGALLSPGMTFPQMIRRSGFPNCPNIIIVMTDDQGYGELGCHGNPVLLTPHLDRFRDESAQFDSFFVSPTCTPTRAGLLTGRHEFRCGISHTILGRSLLREDEVTIADVLADAGYQTGLFGKWHLGDNYPCRPMDRGFQECLFHGGGGITQTPDFWGNTYFEPTLNHNGVWEKTDGYCTDVFFDAALQWIESVRGQPFFALITPNAPHEPLQVSDQYSHTYLARGLDPDSAKFYGMIENIDDNMGKLILRIHELGLESTTLIVFLTDNGSAQACRHDLFNAGMRGCKGSPHEGGVRVPCFFRWPGVLEGGTRIDRIAAHLDILPTIAEICGAKLPRERKLDGVSLIPLLAGKSDGWPGRFLFTHVGRWPAGVMPPEYENCSVRSQRFRFVNNSELYDMDADYSQSVNVIDSFPDIAVPMRRAYDQWWREVLPRVTNPQRIKLGAREENPSLLTCMDWGASTVVKGEPDWRKVAIWVQDCLAALAKNEPYLMGGERIQGGAMGAWAVDFVRGGRYSLKLRKLPLTAPDAWNRLNAGTAHLTCGTVLKRKTIPAGDTAVVFEIRIDNGPAMLECWFDGQRYDGGVSGAYFVEVEFLGNV